VALSPNPRVVELGFHPVSSDVAANAYWDAATDGDLLMANALCHVAARECVGDTDGNGVINFLDLNAVLSAFGQSGEGLPADLNGDGVVNFLDLNTVLSAFGTEC
jgi:hypothetical protein